MRVLTSLIVCLFALGAYAGAPTVDQSLASFPQNGGTFSVTGSGFVFDDPAQFDWILSIGGMQFHSNPNIRTGSPVIPGTGAADWTGCKLRTLNVNAPGTRVTCTMQWIPDELLEGVGGVATIMLDVVNGNGMLGGGPTIVAIVQNVNERVFVNTAPVPNVLYGFTITGSGFPAFDSLDLNNDLFQVTLQDGPNTLVVDVLAGVLDTTYVTYDSSLFNAAPALFDTRTNSANFANAVAQCTFDEQAISCWYIPNGFDVSPPGSPTNALLATVTIGSADLSATFDVIGPAQIAIINKTPAAPTADESLTQIDWSTSQLTITGSGFATAPSIQSNIVVLPVAGRAGQPNRCDVTSVNAAGTVLTCRLFTPFNDGLGGVDDLPFHVLTADQWTYAVDIMLPGPVPQVAARLDFDFPLAQTSPRTDGVQRDASLLVITSGVGSFPVDGLLDLDDAPTNTAAAGLPSEIQTVVTLEGILSGSTIDCTFRVPNWPRPVTTATVPATPDVSACTIVSMSRSRIVLRIPPIETVPGTAIGADITTTWVSSGQTLTHPFAVVGVVAVGSGAGGDPHFVGLLGTQYTFDGEVGHVYNLLSDEGVQVNTLIGKMYLARDSNQTIMRQISVRLPGNHLIVMDAGGNSLGSAAFSLTWNGWPVRPVHDRNDTSDVIRVGKEATLRWFPLTQHDDVRPDLWQMHVAVAQIELVLPNYSFVFNAIEQGRDSNGNWHQQPVRFMDFSVKMFDQSRHPSGIIGQSAHPPPGTRRLGIEWDYEGNAGDYEVSGLAGSDFEFNQFHDA